MDHYRAVPLSDGCHFLYTDPCIGTLSLGADALAGPPDRLICEARFRPPSDSSLPLLYTAEFDTRHNLCVMATFSAGGGDDCIGSMEEGAGVIPLNFDPPKSLDMNMQMIVLYIVPSSMFAVISEGRCRQWCVTANRDEREGDLLMDEAGTRTKGSSNNIHFADDASAETTVHRPFEIRGQPVARCHNLVELALDLGLDTVLWAFSAQGWARAWILHDGREEISSRVIVQPDGSLRHVDSNGDCSMTDDDQVVSTPKVTMGPVTNLEAILSMKTDTTVPVPQAGRYCGPATRILESDNSGGMVSVALNGITRFDVELG
ncbi:hypothetical protein FVEN_g1747 [Fusarium venenatum]|uniref:Uncharacterized protein n=1 Tax=Fusarium venenatum TaxID=56646 RepID=A0A2L2SQH3_9HYPO|nr:uncharacterized protein FVRRES_13017 [Fusarium venenatum]KAG8360920.1 hypothetical protein FVEN_g1747 [Fusarium venenatum]KAH6979586.1 hypothetical protein EDB82DRAFT_261747 [Fusarium venenatum]CEI40326.1 unnamed protein product [Fusarium venenatum]